MPPCPGSLVGALVCWQMAIYKALPPRITYMPATLALAKMTWIASEGGAWGEGAARAPGSHAADG